MKKFTFANRLFGWITFAIAAITYLLTMEPTASWWDCGEFITTAFRLEVGHPPGAPLFMILARFFTLFSPDKLHVAVMVNSMSALASAFTILFLFWTITHLARKIFLTKEADFTTSRIIAVIGSGLVGALAYTFSDTFWFSAVEGEVYATSSLFTAIVFWAILKWEEHADEPHANRWLIFIAYLMGLSIGVHLLNLLAIPAMVFVYYFRKYKPSGRGISIALIASVLILGCVMYLIIPGILSFASFFEKFFVNSIGLPYNSGVIIYILTLLGLIFYGIYFSYKKKKILLNTIVLGITMLIIGYSSYAMIVIRSWADPPINENNPDNVFTLLKYLNRDQYGDRPLFYGQYFNAPVTGTKPTRPTYTQKDGKYVITNQNEQYVYDSKMCTVFPRMYSSEASHIRVYKEWADIKGTQVQTVNEKGEPVMAIKPTFSENLKFFFKYQLGQMYFRYFLWNFSGRQNDMQGHGGVLKGNWITGYNVIDEMRLGPQKNLPSSMQSNRSRNVYYMLPLILGLLGLVFHFQVKPKDGWIVSLLFFFTGLAIVIYLNQTPIQPRERDYAYAGSFYAFAIWIGLGVLAILDMIKKSHSIVTTMIITVLCLAFVPGIMAKENWDDHDRSGRYTVRDIARNYLNSCAPNAILFTNGDNDTFPLWYVQEVEGVRPDVRIVNLMLLNMDWYIDQMKVKCYDSDPLPITFDNKKYLEGTRDVVYVTEQLKDFEDLGNIVEFIKDDSQRTKVLQDDGKMIAYIPTRKFKLPVDTSLVLRNGTIPASLKNQVVPSIDWTVQGSYLSKSDMILMDILVHNKWKRPLYFVSTGKEGCLNLDEYLQAEGIVYRLVPVKTDASDWLNIGRINTKDMYDKLMNKFTWGRMNQPDVWVDEFNQRTLQIIKLRNTYNRLAEALIQEGKKADAIKVLDRIVELTPPKQVPYDMYMIGIAGSYFKAGDSQKGNELIDKYASSLKEDLDYYLSFSKNSFTLVDYESNLSLKLLGELAKVANENKQIAHANRINEDLEKYNRFYLLKGGKSN
jgi:hypothetical protein